MAVSWDKCKYFASGPKAKCNIEPIHRRKQSKTKQEKRNSWKGFNAPLSLLLISKEHVYKRISLECAFRIFIEIVVEGKLDNDVLWQMDFV